MLEELLSKLSSLRLRNLDYDFFSKFREMQTYTALINVHKFKLASSLLQELFEFVVVHNFINAKLII